MRSRAVIVLGMCLLMIACGDERPRRTARPAAVRPEITLPADLPPARARHEVRDVMTQQAVAVEDRGGLLVLRSAGRVIDTLTGTRLGDTVVERRSSSVSRELLRFDSQLTGGPLESDLVLVADGELVIAAELTAALRLPREVVDTSYRTTFSIDESGPTIHGVESWRFRDSSRPELVGAWNRPFTLRFDVEHRVFSNAVVPLDSVPVEAGARFVSGSYPAILLAAGTRVYIDGAWYALSLPDDLDLEEFARGTSGVIREGRGVFRDTLKPIR